MSAPQEDRSAQRPIVPDGDSAESGLACAFCGALLSRAHLDAILDHPDRRYLCEGWGCRVVYWWTEGELHWTTPL